MYDMDVEDSLSSTPKNLIKFEDYEQHLPQALPTIKRRTSSSFLDPVEYYKTYKQEDSLRDLTGECYIGFSKLLKTELRLYDRRDSFILKHSLSMSKNNMGFRQQSSEF